MEHIIGQEPMDITQSRQDTKKSVLNFFWFYFVALYLSVRRSFF
jgi:hypothetical protein